SSASGAIRIRRLLEPTIAGHLSAVKSPTRFTAVAQRFVSGRCHKVHQKAHWCVSPAAAVGRCAPSDPHRAGSGRVVSYQLRFTTTAHSMPAPHRRHHGPKPDRRRALELLAASPDGCTEALMFGNGFPAELLIELVRAGLASAHAERMVADGKMTELARMKLSEAGWQALADDAINVRAKST